MDFLYANVADMLDYFGSREPIQLTQGITEQVTDSLLRQVVSGEDVSGEDQEQVAAAQKVKQNIERGIGDAESIINTYLVDKYSLPIDPVPLRLKSVCCDIARMQLHVDTVPDAVAHRNKMAMDWLRDVSSGRARLGVDEEDEAPQPRNISFDAPDRQFKSDKLIDDGFTL